MEEELRIHATGKAERYKELLPQVEALIGGEKDEVANMANMAAALRQAFGFFWVGFYRVIGEELVLGPFQGPVACTRIRYGKGVCGTAWKEEKSQIVPDVDLFPGHIACNSASKSEIVIPFWKEEKIAGVLDIDSDQTGSFDETDAFYLQQMLRFLVNM